MKYYAKVGFNDDKEAILKKFADAGVDPDLVILDTDVQQKKAGSTYTRMKESLADTGEPLYIDSLFSLGKNAREISKELKWLKDHGINLYVADLPSTLEDAPGKMDLICEINERYADREIEKIKAGQKASKKGSRTKRPSIGRPPLPYPANWEEQFHKWQQKEITSAEFRESVGLSQGTFYNMQRRYIQEQLRNAREEKESGDETGGEAV